MSVKLVKQNFIIDKELMQFRIGKYDCRIVYGNRYYGISSEEPVQIEVLIEIPREENFFSVYDKPFETFLYKKNLYKVDTKDGCTEDEMKVLIKHHYYKDQKKFKKIQKEIELFESLDTKIEVSSREPIPETVRFSVWRRDEGKCVQCGSNKNLEFDHIIPFSQGGSNTERNIQLLCEKCNRIKSDKI
jgi:hypothetical protein